MCIKKSDDIVFGPAGALFHAFLLVRLVEREADRPVMQAGRWSWSDPEMVAFHSSSSTLVKDVLYQIDAVKEENMLSHLFRWFTLQILLGGMRTGQPIPYWDLLYIYKYGLPEIPIYWPPQPLPDPSPLSSDLIRDSLLLDVLELAMGDPNPQPNSWMRLLGNKEARVTAAKKLLEHINQAVPQLEAEIQRLERTQ